MLTIIAMESNCRDATRLVDRRNVSVIQASSETVLERANGSVTRELFYSFNEWKFHQQRPLHNWICFAFTISTTL
ncbi:hypothetical protein GCK32_016724 [Trichostrongylus colubriformis]|uniref:Uncharacterized protein n=1 Tax=Trichostrongylus colubriformis TaxID=6319 RepID=A0AAN8IE78_TRICO